MPKTSIAADAAGALGVFAILAVVLGPALVHLGLFSSLRGFVVFAFGLLPCALLAFLFGSAGLLRTRPASGRLGRGRAWLGTLAGAGLLLIAGSLLFQARHAPPIHDITTNTTSPPAFSDSVRAARVHQNGVDYPDGGPSVEGLQVQAYPDLTSIILPVSTNVALDVARRAAEQLGWKVTRVDPTEGHVEAYDVSRVFMFTDDIVIRIRPAGASSIVDVRSSSRLGVGDLGKNAARIRAFRKAVLAMTHLLGAGILPNFKALTTAAGV
jgi:uncharacterized protein (DUF1499 family)